MEQFTESPTKELEEQKSVLQAILKNLQTKNGDLSDYSKKLEETKKTITDLITRMKDLIQLLIQKQQEKERPLEIDPRIQKLETRVEELSKEKTDCEKELTEIKKTLADNNKFLNAIKDLIKEIKEFKEGTLDKTVDRLVEMEFCSDLNTILNELLQDKEAIGFFLSSPDENLRLKWENIRNFKFPENCKGVKLLQTSRKLAEGVKRMLENAQGEKIEEYKQEIGEEINLPKEQEEKSTKKFKLPKVEVETPLEKTKEKDSVEFKEKELPKPSSLVELFNRAGIEGKDIDEINIYLKRNDISSDEVCQKVTNALKNKTLTIEESAKVCDAISQCYLKNPGGSSQTCLTQSNMDKGLTSSSLIKQDGGHKNKRRRYRW